MVDVAKTGARISARQHFEGTLSAMSISETVLNSWLFVRATLSKIQMISMGNPLQIMACCRRRH